MARPKLSNEEKRDLVFKVSLNKEEFMYMEECIKKSNWGCRRKYLMEVSKGNSVRPQVTDVALFNQLRDVFIEVRHIGTNINQIAKKVNSFDNNVSGTVIDYELRKCIELMEMCHEQTTILADVAKKISDNL